MCDLEVIGDPSIFRVCLLRVIHNDAALVRMLTTFDLRYEENTVHLKCLFVDYETLKRELQRQNLLMNVGTMRDYRWVSMCS